MEDKIFSELKLVETKSESFRQTLDQLQDRASSIISLTLQWKDIDAHFSSIRNVIEELAKELRLIQQSAELKCEQADKKLREIEAREKKFEQIQSKEVEEREREIEWIEKSRFELDAVTESLERKLGLLEEQERRILLLNDSMDGKASQIRDTEEEISRKMKEIEAKEKQFDELSKIIAYKEKKLEEERRELGLKEERFKNIETKEKQIQAMCEELELEKKKFMERSKEFELKEKKLEEERKERFKNIETKEKQIQAMCEELELEKKKFMERSKEFELKEKKLEEERKKLGLKEEKFKDLESKEKQIQAMCEEFELEKKKFMEQSKEFEVKEKQLEERCGEFELKEKHFGNGHRNPLVDKYGNDSSLDANLHFTVIMDGKALQIFLNEHCEEHNSMRGDLFNALRLSSDPAKLVLDAMEGFYPPHLENGNKKFEVQVVRKSCILLLEELMKISTEIKQPVKKEAIRLAFNWLTKMKVDAEHYLKVLGFLQLLASYGLASEFDSIELLSQMEIVAQHSQAPELFRLLGLTDKISGFIKNLIGKQQYIEAIRFIYAYGLVSEFPPETLLDKFLKDSEAAARKTIKKGHKSLDDQIVAATKRIADIGCALKCITDYNIEFGPNLKQPVDDLKLENSKWKSRLSFLKSQHLAPTAVAAIDAPKLTSIPVTSTQSEEPSGNERPWAAISAEDNLTINGSQATSTVPIHVKTEPFSLSDLPSHSQETLASLNQDPKANCPSVDACKDDLRRLIDLLENPHYQHREIVSVLRSACDPGKLVLDVMNVSFPLKLEKNKQFKSDTPIKMCIFLLGKLKKNSLSTEIKEQAKEFALQWKPMLLKEKRPLEVVCFLQFLAAYSLASVFGADELLFLLGTNLWHKHASNLCRVLGLADKIPGFIEDHIKKAKHLEAVKYIYALHVVDKFPPVPILEDYMSLNDSSKKSNSTRVETEDIREEIKSLEAVKKCILDYKVTGISERTIQNRIRKLNKKIGRYKRSKAYEPYEVKTGSCPLSNSNLDQQVSLASAPLTSASTPNNQPQQEGENKRRRLHISSEDPPKAPVGALPAAHSTQFPQQHALGFYMQGGGPCMNMPPRGYTFSSYPPPPRDNGPPRHYGLAAYPPYNMGLNNNAHSVDPSYHQTAFGNPAQVRGRF